MQAAGRLRLEPILIHYSIEPADPDRHWFVVECSLEAPQARQVFRMPSWIPGSYLLREFARHIVEIEAFDDGRQIEIEKIDKSGWVVEGAEGPLLVRATIFAHDRSVRGAWLDRLRAFFNGTSVFLAADGFEDSPVRLRIVAPERAELAAWRVATALSALEVDDRGFGLYQADSYDELIDHPVEISQFQDVRFEAAEVGHRLVVAGRFETDLERIAADLTQLCTAQIEFFGRPPPFGAYTFLGLAVGEGYGGLEHRASSSLMFNRNDLPRLGEQGMPASYQRFLALCSHEYFHSWHIKRSRPQAFVPYRLDRRNYTRTLWVFEGITSYYQERFLLTSGLLGGAGHLRRLGEALSRVYRVPGRFRQSLAESSFDAWDRLYKPGPESVNTGVSYYSKGSLVALALDLTLRRNSEGRVSLDAIVKELWHRYGREDIGVPENGFEALAIELGGNGLEDFFDTAIRSTDDLDMQGLLADFGIGFSLRAPASSDADQQQAKGDAATLTLGASIRGQSTGFSLESVLDGGPAESAGLAAGDSIIALDGYVVEDKHLTALLGRYAAGDRIDVAFIRDGVLLHTSLQLAERLPDTCELHLLEEADPQALARRRDWLGE